MRYSAQHSRQRNRRGSTTSLVVVALVALVVLSAIAYWVSFTPDDQVARESREPERLRIVVSGDTHGWIVPCGCTSNQSGGLPRRAEYLSQLRANHDVVLADCGGAAGGDSLYELARFEAILRGEVQMGINAHNIGASELAFGPAAIRNLASKTNCPLVSANAHDVKGELVAPTHETVWVGGFSIGFIGVVSPKFATDEFAIGSPRAAVLEVLDGFEARPDYVVVLAYLPDDELRKLAGELPEVDAVVGGPTGQSIVPTQVGAVTLAAATNKGKFIVELAVDEQKRQLAGKVVELDESFKDDDQQLANLLSFRNRLADRDFTAIESGFAKRTAGTLSKLWKVAGSESCATCHEEDCTVWHDSAHSHAWATLKKDKAFVDSYCQQCHTTGFGQPDGFLSAKRSLNRVDVGCESCHGPSFEHVQTEGTKPTPFRAADQCLICHDRENSPEFEYEEYWSDILHGGEEK